MFDELVKAPMLYAPAWFPFCCFRFFERGQNKYEQNALLRGLYGSGRLGEMTFLVFFFICDSVCFGDEPSQVDIPHTLRGRFVAPGYGAHCTETAQGNAFFFSLVRGVQQKWKSMDPVKRRFVGVMPVQ